MAGIRSGWCLLLLLLACIFEGKFIVKSASWHVSNLCVIVSPNVRQEARLHLSSVVGDIYLFHLSKLSTCMHCAWTSYSHSLPSLFEALHSVTDAAIGAPDSTETTTTASGGAAAKIVSTEMDKCARCSQHDESIVHGITLANGVKIFKWNINNYT